ncbi:MAG: thiamine ABC transporter substrate-binding protein, partial [Candidatus Kariarchaeaceae archaeon]|jgi:thiamine transport system substrate-binding protein
MSSASISVDQSPSLVIYTYDSLLADPGYAFDRAFEVYAGLPNGSVQVNYLSDTGTILSRAIAEKNNPVADILIGIDNVLVHQAREENILTPYIPDGAEQLIDGLVDDLASDYLLTPYDYGVIALWYLNQEFEGDLDTEEFSLDQLLTEEFRSQLIVQDPRLSSPGLGFLLTSIALYGDDSDGILEGSWQDFWRSLSQETAITSSWGDAITRLYAEEDRTMMVSYTSSPAYGNCLWEDDTTTAVLPTVDGVQYGWQQIEGIGLVNNAPHTDLAMDFIDWFISEELQEQIHLNQWVYPARDGISAPDCYNTSIDPSTITPLNSLLSPDTVEQQLDMWLTDWEVSWIEGPVSSNDGLPINWIAALLLIPILRRRNKV